MYFLTVSAAQRLIVCFSFPIFELAKADNVHHTSKEDGNQTAKDSPNDELE